MGGTTLLHRLYIFRYIDIQIFNYIFCHFLLFNKLFKTKKSKYGRNNIMARSVYIYIYIYIQWYIQRNYFTYLIYTPGHNVVPPIFGLFLVFLIDQHSLIACTSDPIFIRHFFMIIKQIVLRKI